jgi:hypothetical protein
MGDRVVHATLNDSAAARDLVAMLPLAIKMDDHLRRENIGVIPRPLSERTPGSRAYDRGDLGYWRPRNTFVIFHRQDGLEIPGPGVVLLGKVDAGRETFDAMFRDVRGEALLVPVPVIRTDGGTIQVGENSASLRETLTSVA